MIRAATCTNDIELWLRSGKPALIDACFLRPLEHAVLAGTPLSVQCGQAQAYFLQAATGQHLILKKFLPGRSPDAAYLRAIGGVLPRQSGFISGTERKVLTAASVQDRFGCYPSKSLNSWIDGTVLMPRVAGDSWASVADDLRSGEIVLEVQQRLSLVKSLAGLVQALEIAGCAHRDLSARNVFVDCGSGCAVLIDFDGVFHARLAMPVTTTAGTEGYLAPFVWNRQAPQPAATWCPHADRFALALLCVEILVMDRDTPLSADGGLFNQEELCAQRGSTIEYAIDRLQNVSPGASHLLVGALRSRIFDQCPSPADWLAVTAASVRSIPQLCDLEAVVTDDLKHLLRRANLQNGWATVPLLSELPNVNFGLHDGLRAIQLHSNPRRQISWSSSH